MNNDKIPQTEMKRIIDFSRLGTFSLNADKHCQKMGRLLSGLKVTP
jgi:hypothetical protein